MLQVLLTCYFPVSRAGLEENWITILLHVKVLWKAGNAQGIKHWKTILWFVIMLKSGSIILPMLNYSSLCIMQLQIFVLLFQAYCPAAIETNRKIHAFISKMAHFWGKIHLPTRIFIFKGKRTIYWRVSWRKLHMFISLCLQKINREKNFPYRSSLCWQWGADLKSSAGLSSLVGAQGWQLGKLCSSAFMAFISRDVQGSILRL